MADRGAFEIHWARRSSPYEPWFIINRDLSKPIGNAHVSRMKLTVYRAPVSTACDLKATLKRRPENLLSRDMGNSVCEASWNVVLFPNYPKFSMRLNSGSHLVYKAVYQILVSAWIVINAWRTIIGINLWSVPIVTGTGKEGVTDSTPFWRDWEPASWRELWTALIFDHSLISGDPLSSCQLSYSEAIPLQAHLLKVTPKR